MGAKLQGAFGLAIIGLVGYGCVSTTVKNYRPPPPLVWHYVGPSAKAALVKEAIDVLGEVCPNVMVYDEYFEKPNVAWRVIDRTDPIKRIGVLAAVNFSTKFKDGDISPAPSMPILESQRPSSADRTEIVMLGPPANALLLSGKGAFFLCEVTDAPIGNAPVMKPAPRLAGLTP